MDMSLFRIILLFLFLSINLSVLAEERHALIIGNGNYQYVAALKNPVNDAQDVAEALKKLKFEVNLVTDARENDIKGIVEIFISRLERSRGIGLFYYAGHGAQLEGENYLIPVNTNITEENEIQQKGFNVSYLLSQMNKAGNTTNIVILDACRDNPFAETISDSNRSLSSNERGMVKIKGPEVSSGLSKLDAPPNTLIAYATAPGRVALDGEGRNSPYTEALIDSMQSEGLTIEQVFKEVRSSLINATNGEQIPWESSSLISDFYFNPRRKFPSGW